ncbi:MAG: TIGR00725 family protein [Bacteroidia bacterium]|nr:TIGR00725 family protein [Bacteroidia bacterium]
MKKQIIGIIGTNSAECKSEIYEFGVNLGEKLTDLEYTIVCGGMGGIMEAVCKGAKKSHKYRFGCTIGIIPSNYRNDANNYCDIVIPTGIGIARNQIIINTADVLIAIAGGSGTLSELAFAWQLNKKVICYTGFEGWAKKLAGADLDERNKGLFVPAGNINEIIKFLEQII